MKEKTKNELEKWILASIFIAVSIAIVVVSVLGITYIADHIPYMAILPFVMIIILLLLAIRQCKKDIDNNEQEAKKIAYLLDCYCHQLWKVTEYVEPTENGYYLVKNPTEKDARVVYFCKDASEKWLMLDKAPKLWCELPSKVMGNIDDNLIGFHFDEYGIIHKHNPLPKYNR